MTEERPSEWQAFFDAHAPQYMTNCFTQNTVAEVDFLLDVLALQPGASVLDVGCGTGRHAVALATRGYGVTGIDLSAGMLTQARKAADGARLSVDWIQADAVEAGTFDPLTLTERSELAPTEGAAALPTCERGFVPTELRLPCENAGLEVAHIWGGTAGNWGRRQLDMDEIEIMVVAHKADCPA